MSDETAPADAAALRILTPGLSPEETAAVTAVLLAAVSQQDGVREVPAGPNPWVRTRQLRGEVRPGPGNWVRALR